MHHLEGLFAFEGVGVVGSIGHQECAHGWRQHSVAHTQLGRATNRSHKYEGLDK